MTTEQTLATDEDHVTLEKASKWTVFFQFKSTAYFLYLLYMIDMILDGILWCLTLIYCTPLWLNNDGKFKEVKIVKMNKSIQ